MAGTANSGGRNAKSTGSHVVQGTFRADRHGAHETPDPPKGCPNSPKAIAGEARGEWNRMVERLEKSGALSIVDDAALYQYVQLFAETERIRAEHTGLAKLSSELKKAIKDLEGSALVAAISEIVKLQQILSKQTTQLRQGHMAIRQYLVEFGLTPAARTRVKLSPGHQAEQPVNPLSRFTRRA